MGTVSEKNIETSSEKVIDYSKNFHSDFMDLYLAKECHFFIASNSGIYSLPLFFRKPTIIPNIIDFSDIPAWSGKELFIPKKFYSESENRFLSFREICEFVSKGQSDHTSYFIEQKVKLIENTREAIREIVIDMDDRLNKTWQETEVDVQLQERFWRLMESCGIHLPP